METRARTRTLLRRAGMSAALVALLVPAAAGTANARSRKPAAPVITSISPKALAIGETLTIRGRHFMRGRLKNTVAFKRTGGAVVFVKAKVGTTKLLKVTLPERLEKTLLVRNGETVPTRLKLRVLAKRFGKTFTAGTRAPMVSPPKPPSPEPPKAAADGDCDGDGVLNGVDTDNDNDLLPDTLEDTLKTDSCKYDSDGDNVSDGYEFQSSVDLNDDEYQGPQSVLPAPYKKPYPNALFADAGVDYDGDSLLLGEEFSLWKAYRDPAKGLSDLVYSDGNQYSNYGRSATGNRPGGLIGPDPELKYVSFVGWAQSAGYWNISVPIHDAPTPVQLNDSDFTSPVTPSEARWYDFDNDGKLSDDERDEDADGLTNFDETRGRLQPSWWSGSYTQEKPYPVAYAGTDPVDPDSDGDGVRDGADDQDHDDLPNLMEVSRKAAAPARPYDGRCGVNPAGAPNPAPEQGFVNPFNPCLPYDDSRTCLRHPAFEAMPAPFDPQTKIYFILR